MDLQQLRLDSATKQKKGLHFILSSVIIWILIFLVTISELPVLRQNLLIFCCSAPLFPIAYFISKWIHVDFRNKTNPLTTLGIIFSVNQMLYLLIAMWFFSTVPDKMLMVFTMIFGAHLMPFSWLYESKTYLILSVFIPVGALIVGLNYPMYVLAGLMICVEVIFSFFLILENRK